MNKDEFRTEVLCLLESILAELRLLSGSGDEEMVAIGSLEEVTEALSKMNKDSDFRIGRRYIDNPEEVKKKYKKENDEDEKNKEGWIV